MTLHHSCHLQMTTKALFEHGPEALSYPVGQGSFEINYFKEGKCSMIRQVHIWHPVGVGFGLACYRHSVQKPASLKVWGVLKCLQMGKGFRASYAPLQGRPCVFQQDNAKPHTATITTAWLQRRVRALNWPAGRPELSPLENIWQHNYKKGRSYFETCREFKWFCA